MLCYISHRCSPRFVHISSKATKNINLENLIDATVVSRFRG